VIDPSMTIARNCAIALHMEFTMPAGVVIVGLDHPSTAAFTNTSTSRSATGFGLRDASWRFTSGTIPSSRGSSEPLSDDGDQGQRGGDRGWSRASRWITRAMIWTRPC